MHNNSLVQRGDRHPSRSFRLSLLPSLFLSVSFSLLFVFLRPQANFLTLQPPAAFFSSLTDNACPTVRCDNRTEIVTVLVLLEIYPCQTRIRCIQPAACVSLSVFLHLTPVIVSPRENVHTNFLAIFHPRADTSHRTRIVLLGDKILRNGYSFSELVSSLGSLFLTPLGWHSTFQILKLCAFMTLHKRAVCVPYTFNIHRIWVVSDIFLFMWKMKEFICIKVHMKYTLYEIT